MIEIVPVKKIEAILIEQKNKCIVLYGPAGIGKTSNALNFAWQMTEKNWICLWFNSETKDAFSSELEALTDAITNTNTQNKTFNYRTMVIEKEMSRNPETRFLIILENLNESEWIESFLACLVKSKNVSIIATSTNRKVLEKIAFELKVEYFNEEQAKSLFEKKFEYKRVLSLEEKALLENYFKCDRILPFDLNHLLTELNRNEPINLKELLDKCQTHDEESTISSATIGINFALPNKKILIERKNTFAQLDRIFRKTNEINFAVLVGEGGSGKTTIARNYAIKQKASIIWEINAETKNSTSLSFEGLAYCLCQNEKNFDKQELRDILNIKDGSIKDRQLILFTQKQLRLKAHWFIIYDNLESLIAEYFPQNSQSWGKGRVIITTRDDTLRNNSYLNSENFIKVDEITEEEKLDLFKNIIGESSSQLVGDQVAVEKFLLNIPSFPLDVSIAAHYLRETGIEFNQYLAEINSPNKEFTQLQASILQDVSEYTKTRYTIISSTIKNITKYNSVFNDFILFIGLLDSQEIPEELLVLHKNQYVTTDFIRKLKKNSLITNVQYKNSAKNSIDNLSSFSIHRSTHVNILVYAIDSLNAKERKEALLNIFTNIQSYILKQIDLENSIGLKNFLRHCESLSSKHDFLTQNNLISINNSLGIIYYYLGSDNKAKKILEKNLNEDKEDNETALILTHLGAIYRKIGQDYQMAIDYLKKAIAIYNKISKDSIREGLALTHLGNTHRTVANFKSAIESLQNSVNIYHKHAGNYAGEARAMGYLGVAYRESGDLTKAKDLLEQAITIYRTENYPKFSSVYAGTLAHLGIVYRMINEYHKAIDILIESVEIYREIRPETHPDICRNILNLGIIYGEIKEDFKAKDLLEKSLNDYELSYGKDHIETGKVLNHLGRFYTLTKNFKNAEESLKRASQILEKARHSESYRSFELLGDLYENHSAKQSMLKKEAAKKSYDKSLELALSFFLADSLNVKRVKEKVNVLNAKFFE